MIENYRFGAITISGKIYTNDIKIIENRVIPNWRRGRGHLLEPGDIRDILDTNPKIVIVGKGASGMMKISDAVLEFAENKGMRLVAKNTGEAVNEYNEICNNRKVCACFHLTC